MFEVFENPERMTYTEMQEKYKGMAVGVLDIEFNDPNDESSGIKYLKVKAITSIGCEDFRIFELYQENKIESILYCVESNPGFMGGVLWK